MGCSPSRATGDTLKKEINSLAVKEILPSNMAEWAHAVIRDPGNDYTHPDPDQPEANAKEAKDIVGYLDFLLEYVYDLPARIKKFRAPEPPPEVPSGSGARPSHPIAEIGGRSR